MADRDDIENDDDQIDDDDAKRLLDDDAGDDDGDKGNRQIDDKGDPDKLGDPGKRALDSMKRERNAARKELLDARAKLKDFEDKDKSESQRLTEAREEAATRAAKAEEKAQALSIAIERAPAHATVAQIRAVAKRVRGESDEDLETDADELFDLLAPAPKEKDEPKKVAGRPRERLRGGGDPDDEPEENDPRKLAEMVRRKRI